MDAYWLLGASPKLGKDAISLVMYVCMYVCVYVCMYVRPSVRMEQLDSHWTDFN
jgi:hypothetical protein